MNKDRGMIKWLPFNSVVNSKELKASIIKEKGKINKPVYCDDKWEELENNIIDALKKQVYVNIIYFKGGYTYKCRGIIKKIDSLNKLIYLSNLKLLFNEIINITMD